MRLIACASVCALMLGWAREPGLAEAVPEERIHASRAVVGAFAGELKEVLTKEMTQNGAPGAIDVCKSMAPEIAAKAAARTGWGVGRTSLKTRNSANGPDAWEADVLRAFAQRRAAGEDPAKMEAWTIVGSGGERRFRYMKAIPVASMCLTCHGSTLDPELRARLDELYPDDAAVGYGEGDIRGAFTITQPM